MYMYNISKVSTLCENIPHIVCQTDGVYVKNQNWVLQRTEISQWKLVIYNTFLTGQILALFLHLHKLYICQYFHAVQTFH